MLDEQEKEVLRRIVHGLFSPIRTLREENRALHAELSEVEGILTSHIEKVNARGALNPAWPHQRGGRREFRRARELSSELRRELHLG